MYKKLIFVTTLLTTLTAALAGNNITIQGKIVERENGKALPFATVVFHTEGDKIISGTTTAEDGSFKISNCELIGEFKIRISYIGFRDTTINLTFQKSSSNVDLGVIALNAQITSLSTVMVTVRVPVIEQKLDKIVMNVAEAVYTQGSNALEVLKMAPGVNVDPSGNIFLNGSAVQVWIDGRPTNLNGADLEALLSGTDGSTIDKIEIIAHPSSKYDAAGAGGIINIKMKKNLIQGINGSSRMAYSGSPYEKYYQSIEGSLMINYRTTRNNLSVNYSPRFNETFNKFESTTELESGKLIKGVTHFDRANEGQNFKISNDFFLNNKNIIGFVVSGMGRTTVDSTQVPASTKLYDKGILIENSLADIKNDIRFENISANLNYTRIFKEGTEMTVNADYFYYDLGRFSNQRNTHFDETGLEIINPKSFMVNSKQYINIKSVKADYEQPFKKNGKIEAGLKLAKSATDNNLLRNDFNGNVWEPNSDQSTVFYYTENISAGFITLANKIGTKLSVKGGLRAELTKAKGEWITSDTVTTKNYLDLFPTLFAGYNPNEKLRLGLSYTMRIQRPGFEQLNPQRFYIDVNTSVLGNPNLEPQYGHHLSFTLGISRHFNFGVNSQVFNKVITQIPSVDSQTGEKLMTWDNFGKLNLLGVNASISEFQITKWLILNASGSLSNVSTRKENYSSKRIFANCNINTSLLLPKDLKIELTGWMQTGIPYGYLLIEPNSEFTLGIRKGLLKKKGNITFLISDIFGTNVNRVSMKDEIFKNYLVESRHRSKRATLIFSYRFGQSKTIRNRNVGNIDETARVNTGF